MASDDSLLLPEEVARIFGVTIKTVARWADLGKLDSMKTVGGHRRYYKSSVDELLNTQQNT